MNRRHFQRLLIAFVSLLFSNNVCHGQESLPDIIAKWPVSPGIDGLKTAQLTFHLKSTNEAMLPSGRMLFSRNGDCEVLVQRSLDGDTIGKVVGINNDYCYLLGLNSAEKELTVLDYDEGENESARRQIYRNSIVSLAPGVYFQFQFVPTLNCGIRNLGCFIDCSKVQRLVVAGVPSNHISYELTIVPEKLKSVVDRLVKDDPSSEELKALHNAQSFGLRRISITVDSKANFLPIEVSTFFEFMRPPITLKMIRAANRAGQRRPDGSKFPDELAEPEGKKVLEQQATKTEFRYELVDDQLLLSEAKFGPEGDQTTSIPTGFEVTGISRARPKNYLKQSEFFIEHYGFGASKESSSKRHTILAINSSFFRRAVFAAIIITFVFVMSVFVFSLRVNSVRIKSSIAILLLTCTVFSANGAVVQVEQTARDSREFVFTLLTDSTLDLTNYSGILEVNESQKTKLATLLDQALAKWIKIQASGTRGKAAESERNIESFVEEIDGQISDILLPDQVSKIRSLLRQRQLLIRWKCEPFELVTKTHLGLGLSPNEKTVFKSKSKSISENYRRELAAFKSNSTKEALAALPPKQRGMLIQTLSFAKLEFAKFGFQRDIIQKFSSKPQKDWGQKEKHYFDEMLKQQTIWRCRDSVAIQEFLELSPDQILEMQTVFDSVGARDDGRELRLKMMKAASEGDVVEFKKIHNEQQYRQLDMNSSIVKKIMDEVMLPHQSELIAELVKFKRFVASSKGFDELGGIISMFGSDSEFPIDDDCVKELKAIQDRQHEKEKQLWDDAASESFGFLPDPVKSTFLEKYGPYFNVAEERVANEQRMSR